MLDTRLMFALFSRRNGTVRGVAECSTSGFLILGPWVRIPPGTPLQVQALGKTTASASGRGHTALAENGNASPAIRVTGQPMVTSMMLWVLWKIQAHEPSNSDRKCPDSNRSARPRRFVDKHPGLALVRASWSGGVPEWLKGTDCKSVG